jgi:glycosyltransferase involved in cell wall biosynthesis
MNTEATVKLSVVIPVYNERFTIEELLWRVISNKIDKEIVIVDDCSTDGTRIVLQQLDSASKQAPSFMTLPSIGRSINAQNIHVIFHERNQGKGAALRTGFKAAKGEMVLVQDADLEYDPEDYYRLLDPIERGVADVVYGSRFLGGPHRVLFFWHAVGNKFLTLISNMLSNLNLTDVWTCYKVFKKQVLGTIELQENRFGFEPEITAKIAKARWEVYEVPISYNGRTYAEGKKITWKDGIRGLYCTVKYNVFTRTNTSRYQSS